ncbi:MAG: hypothetical protein J6I97_08600, partial [Agathobacter sp.]|nr:hypothetical protein [Agathobacter sp.]
MSMNEGKESYELQYTREELAEITNLLFKKNETRFIMCLILWFVLIIIGFSHNDIILLIILSIFFVRHILRMRKFFASKKLWKDSEERISQTMYSYDFYNTFFHVNIHRNGEDAKEETIYLSELKNVTDIGKYLILQTGNGSYIIRKENLNSDAILYTEYWKRQANEVPQKASGLWGALSLIFCIGSYFSIYGALLVESKLSQVNHLFTENMWVFFLFVPIPIVSIIIGVFLKRKGFKYKKNIIAGITMTILLCIYGSMAFISGDFYDHSEDYILRVEDYLNIDIPKANQINTKDWTDSTSSSSREESLYESDIYFDENQISEFENEMKEDENWLSAVPN